MKKTFIALFAIAMIGGTVVSCKKDKKSDCETMAKNLESAIKGYAADGSTNCKAYKAALQDAINSDCTTAEQKSGYQMLFDLTDCDTQ